VLNQFIFTLIKLLIIKLNDKIFKNLSEGRRCEIVEHFLGALTKIGLENTGVDYYKDDNTLSQQ